MAIKKNQFLTLEAGGGGGGGNYTVYMYEVLYCIHVHVQCICKHAG